MSPPLVLVFLINCFIDFFLSENGQDILFQTLVSSLSSTVDDILYTTNAPFTALATVIEFTRIMLSKNHKLTSDSLVSVLPNVFIVGYLLPVTFPTLETPIIDAARGVWNICVSKPDNGLQDVLSGIIKEKLKELFQDCSTYTRFVHLAMFCCTSELSIDQKIF